ncbi:hypothetical protein H8356DRAFT_1348587 [Neocallimastix lanati (nom. inval.)]|nr:hypothetical protein H8356DRAFT_1348587 [Neocallimastix sp. JGI-2020a]
MSIYQQDQNNKVLCVGVQLSRVESWIEPDPPLIFCAMCSCLQREGFIVLGRICLIVKDLFLEILAFTIYKTLQNSCLFTASCHAGTTATVFNIKYSSPEPTSPITIKIRTLVQWLVTSAMTNTSWCKPIEFSPFCVSISHPAFTIEAPPPQYLYAIPQTFYRTFRNSTFSISFGNRWTNNYCLLIPIQIITLSVLSYPHYYIIQSFVFIILPDNPNPISSYTELEELSSLVLHSTNRFGSRLGAYVTEGVRLKLYSILKFYFVLTRGTSYNSTDGFFYSSTEVGLCFPNNKLDIIKNLTILLPFVCKTLTIDFICVITKRLKELIV